MKKKLLTATLATTMAFFVAESYSADSNTICLLTGMPPSNITVQTIKKIKAGKHSFGSVNAVIPLLIREAKKLNADAVINYNGSQRFGFWPWQFIRPIATGVAVTWTLPEGTTCESIGGTYKTRLNGPLTTDV